MTVKINTAMRNDILDTCMGQDFFSATISLYTGTQPATAGGAHSDTLLALFVLNGFNAASAGVMGLDIPSMTTPVTPIANGTVGWARIDSGSGYIFDVSVTVTAGGGDIEIDDVVLSTSGSVDLLTFNITQPAE